VVKSCAQPELVSPLDATITALPSQRPDPRTPHSAPTVVGRDTATDQDWVAMQIGFRGALTVGCGMWASFFSLDLVVIHFLNAGSVAHFLAARVAVLLVLLAVLFFLHEARKPTEWTLTTADLISCGAATMGTAFLCLEFRGIASPYVPGICLVLLSRTVTLHYQWRRGIVMTGIPIVLALAVIFGAALFSPRIAAQFHDPAAVTTFLISVSYILGTSVFQVVGGHIVWSLRRQVFEARSLGRYRLKRRIASGGMGDVWVAYHPGLKRDVAVKILRPDHLERSSSALSRFEREVRATAALMHPNTVRVFDYGTTEDGLWYYVMELLEGETLAQHVTRLGALSPARAVHMVGQAARALGEAHENGIVHRDVKPENLFVTSLGGEHDFVKVLDFGIAKVTSLDEGGMTDTGCVLGTPAYISPEVATGQVADARSDVYGLGGVLYFLLCGRAPFQADTPGALIFAHVHERVVAPSRMLGRQLPADVEAVVMRALEKEPAARYQTAAELALALASCSLAGTWTFGDATFVARRSSRPPASGMIEAMPSLKAPPLPKEWENLESEDALETSPVKSVSNG
jgi:serine/threonine-protein kinase